jgi:hypothetical protein
MYPKALAGTAAPLGAARLIGICAITVATGGCMSAQIQESRELATAITKDEAVVLLAKPVVEGAGTEEGFTDCIGENLRGGEHGFKVQDNNEFVDKLFPWFEPSTAPTRPEALSALFQRPGVAERIAETGVRYVVWLDGATKKTDGGGSIACGAGPGGAGCIGFGWWEKESDYQATIWDLQQLRTAGTVTTNVTGTSALVGAVVPLPFIARVQGTACNRLSAQLRSFLRGDEATAAEAASQ